MYTLVCSWLSQLNEYEFKTGLEFLRSNCHIDAGEQNAVNHCLHIGFAEITAIFFRIVIILNFFKCNSFFLNAREIRKLISSLSTIQSNATIKFSLYTPPLNFNLFLKSDFECFSGSSECSLQISKVCSGILQPIYIVAYDWIIVNHPNALRNVFRYSVTSILSLQINIRNQISKPNWNQ